LNETGTEFKMMPISDRQLQSIALDDHISAHSFETSSLSITSPIQSWFS